MNDSELPLTSQRISEILGAIGRSNIPEQFMNQFTIFLEPEATLLYDITGLSSSSQLIELFEYGYNRDNDGLPQINLSLVVDKKRGIPIQYEICPGSIADITTLHNTIRRLYTAGLEHFKLILDRGFFSQTILAELIDTQIPFIIPATIQLTSVKELMSKAQVAVKRAEFLQKFEKGTIFAMPVTLEHHYDLEKEPRTLTVKGYCYYDPRRELEEKNSFYINLHDVVEKLQNCQPKNWRRPETVVHEIAKGYSKFLSWKFIDGRFEVAIKQKAVTQRVNRMGKIILFHSREMDWIACLTH